MSIEIVLDDNKRDAQIYDVVKEAFNQDVEAKLVMDIKKESDFYISLIALDENEVVGHVMVSPMLLNGIDNVLCLAPVSVKETHQQKGIGIELIKKALHLVFETEDYDFITVLGSDHYYRKFGFKPYDDKKFNIPFDVEHRFYQVLEIEKGCLKHLSGDLTYPDYFN